MTLGRAPDALETTMDHFSYFFCTAPLNVVDVRVLGCVPREVTELLFGLVVGVFFFDATYVVVVEFVVLVIVAAIMVSSKLSRSLSYTSCQQHVPCPSCGSGKMLMLAIVAIILSYG